MYIFLSQHHQGAVFEIGALGEHRDGIIAQALSQGFETEHCSFCRFYGDCMVEIPGLVFNPKTRRKEPGIRKLTLHTLKEEDEDINKYKRAKNCSRWRIDPSRLKRFQEKNQDKVFGDTVILWHKQYV